MSINWGGSVDDLVASWARPFAIYTSSFAIAVCCFLPHTQAEALPLAAGIVAGGGVLRTIDKKTAAAAVSPAATAEGKPKTTG